MNNTQDQETTPPVHGEADATEFHDAICPYFIKDRGRGIVNCECAKFKFPDRGSRREIVYRFCAHPTGYKACMIKQAMDHYYERKYKTS